jgi:hypothetical protein
MTIIGLGNAGCNIAELFEGDEKYNVILIDKNIEGENCIPVKEQKTPEDYEKNAPSLSNYLDKIGDRAFLIVGGSGMISGASLRILQQLKERELNIIYIRPQTNSLAGNNLLQEKLTFNVLQEYARSGIFKKIYLVSNPNVENILGDLPVIGYYQKINEYIFNCLNFILTNETTDGIFGNIATPKDIARICTVGVYDIKNNVENYLYNLQNISDKYFYFVFNEEKLKTDGSILKNIKSLVTAKAVDNCKVSFTIYSTKQEQDYCFIHAFSQRIQE